MLHVLKGVIFDLDGLLIDSEPLQQQAYAYCLQREGVVFSEEDFIPYLGRRTAEIIRALIEKYALDISDIEFRKLRDDTYVELLHSQGKALPGAVNLVAEARRYGLKTAIASASSLREVSASLKLLRLADSFDVVVTSDHVKNSKPDPEIYLLALEKLALQASSCVAIEDSEPGLRSASAAGLITVLVPNRLTHKQDLSGATAILESLEQLNLFSLEGIIGS